MKKDTPSFNWQNLADTWGICSVSDLELPEKVAAIGCEKTVKHGGYHFSEATASKHVSCYLMSKACLTHTQKLLDRCEKENRHLDEKFLREGGVYISWLRTQWINGRVDSPPCAAESMASSSRGIWLISGHHIEIKDVDGSSQYTRSPYIKSHRGRHAKTIMVSVPNQWLYSATFENIELIEDVILRHLWGYERSFS